MVQLNDDTRRRISIFYGNYAQQIGRIFGIRAFWLFVSDYHTSKSGLHRRPTNIVRAEDVSLQVFNLRKILPEQSLHFQVRILTGKHQQSVEYPNLIPLPLTYW